MTDLAVTERPAARGDQRWELRLEQHRAELTAYAYRMLGSAFEAEDAVQETFLRAWRSLDSFEGRSALRSWLYRITTNVCFDMLNGRVREPTPDARVVPEPSDPAEEAEIRETVRLALIATLQHLAPKQRAVLILREVLCWKASEVAELLHTSVASVNSALQRARWTLKAGAASEPAPPMNGAQRSLLARYVDAFERYDIDSLLPLFGVPTRLEQQPSSDR